MSKQRIWEQIRAKLKKRFFAAGITECELKWGGCFITNFLTFAHRMKRRKMPSWKKEPEAHKAELEVVILACQKCHEQLDRLPADEMLDITNEVINARKKQPR